MAPQLLKDSLDDLISKEAIHTVLQPIVNLKQHDALGYEALTRGHPGHLLQRPDLMFQAAHQFERIPELELLCIRSAVRHFASLQIPGLLFINICPQTLLTYSDALDEMALQLEKAGLSPADVVLEISERFPIDNGAEFIRVISGLKALGFGIAIDDLGAGYSGLKLWSEIQPDYVKIDRHFIDRIDQDTVKQAFVTSVVHLCQQLDCEIIAEGIEQTGEVNLLRSLGIQIGQGYLLGRPAQHPEVLIPEDDPLPQALSNHTLDLPIGHLCQPVRTIHPDMNLLDADTLFKRSPLLMSIPVLEDERPVGLLHRRRILEMFAMPYGRALFERKTVQHAMQQDPLIVDQSMTLEAVSKIMTDDEDHYLRQHLIVTHQGNYSGLVNTKDLLKRITDNQILKARYANPLTLLPGNVPIDEAIARLLRHNKRFSLLYADLNFFKPFNDHYGYRQGDNVLRWLGKLLQNYADNHTFVGHIGGDDFLLITEDQDIALLCDSILENFRTGVQPFHSEDDWAQGYIPGSDRNGNACQLPLLSLAIGVVPSTMIQHQDQQALSTLATRAKRLAKQHEGSHWHCLSEDSARLVSIN
ncbi:GGDEF domain-containing protein [Thalassolituus sp. LLYu03]|uniref:GGDEF domain-containing protein n=1 Tax=Thalassolituus sp. LLYu03 TaxID=3421656 RepID=UPI003D2C8AB0